MFNVRSAEEALAVAREMCGRHPGLVELARQGRTDARDAALRVLLAEAARPGQRSSSQDAAHSPSPPGRGRGGGAAYGQDDDDDAAAGDRGTRRTARGGPASDTDDCGSVASSSRRQGGLLSKSGRCFYCDEPSSRFCKETGRRHETADEKIKRQWRHMYRQLALASSFVNNARLAKVNTCVEEYGVMLDLDDM